MTRPEDEPPATRSIELEVEVAGTPEEVWEAIATGPGITSWYVPTEVEAHPGGIVRQSFGPSEEMQVEGRVSAWDPPRRFAFGEGSEGGEPGGMAFEFLVEARDGGTCVVRLVNSGFGTGEGWDDQYDGMAEGWKLFLHNLQLHRELFAPQHAVPTLPTAVASGGRASAWARLREALGIVDELVPGGRLETSGDAPTLAGEVRTVGPSMASIIVEEPAPGTGFLVVEGTGDIVSISVWLYLYGEAGVAAAGRDEPAWTSWLARVFPPPPMPPA